MNAVYRKAGLVVRIHICIVFPSKKQYTAGESCVHYQRNKQHIGINTHTVLEDKLSRKPIPNIKWSSIAPLPAHSNTLLLHNAERERAQDRATEQGSGF